MAILHHPWHHVPTGDKAPDIVNAVIEIPRGSKAKYEIDKPSGLIRLDRVLFSAVHYPANYGFIPQTLSEDNDPLDILVFCQIDLPPRTLVEARVIGVMGMIDQNEVDHKIIAVAMRDVSMARINHLDELPRHLQLEMSRFFEDYKKLEREDPGVVVEQFQGPEAAYTIIRADVERYRERFGTPLEAVNAGQG